jgi:hypothetical protein
MGDISLQFHATPEEILPQLVAFLDQRAIDITAIKFPPFEARQVDKQDLTSIFQDASVRRVALTLSAPKLPVNSMNAFLDQNAGALILDLGRRDEAGLNESWLTTRTQDRNALTIWRVFAKRLRLITRTGVVAINPQTGASVKLSEHRFSEGAKTLEREGVPMLPVAGTSRLRFDE